MNTGSNYRKYLHDIYPNNTNQNVILLDRKYKKFLLNNLRDNFPTYKQYTISKSVFCIICRI